MVYAKRLRLVLESALTLETLQHMSHVETEQNCVAVGSNFCYRCAAPAFIRLRFAAHDERWKSLAAGAAQRQREPNATVWVVQLTEG